MCIRDRLNLGSEGHTNIDQVYQELSSRWPEFFSEQEQTHPTDPVSYTHLDVYKRQALGSEY